MESVGKTGDSSIMNSITLRFWPGLSAKKWSPCWRPASSAAEREILGVSGGKRRVVPDARSREMQLTAARAVGKGVLLSRASWSSGVARAQGAGRDACQ
jgi:hypothetical protein